MECNSEKLGEIPEMEDLWIVQRGVHFLGIFEKKKECVLVIWGEEIAKA